MALQSTSASAWAARTATINEVRAGTHPASAIYQDLSARLDAIIINASTQGARSVNLMIEVDSSMLVENDNGALGVAASAALRQDVSEGGFIIHGFSFETPSMLFVDIEWRNF